MKKQTTESLIETLVYGAMCLGFLGAISLIIALLKLVGVFPWGWLWVLAPVWIPVFVFGGFIGLFFLVILAFSAIMRCFVRRK